MDPRVKNIGNRNSYLNNVMWELRDHAIQQDRMRFRFNLRRVGEILAYEISKDLDYEPRNVRTPLGELELNVIEDPPVLVSILRAGIPLHEGFLHVFDRADNGFVAAYRHTTKGNEFIVKVEYQAIPSILGRSVILIDPMIASGKSMVLCYQQMVEEFGRPEKLYIAGVIASEDGLAYVSRHIPHAQIYVAAVDDEMTAKSYIVPGLGDAGDLAFGPK
ncbi:MAG: uracil phosphoribosyltransferase [Bacteroidota bacterium]